jgi:uncharacterized membrane protein
VPSTSSERGFERFVFFSDAVVAIAISLLILPVVDSASDLTGSAEDLMRDNSDRLLAFGLSFVVIARFWIAHHALFGRIERQNRRLMWLNLAWLLTIVFLPLPTELLGVRGAEESFVRGLYIGAVFACSVLLAILEGVVDTSSDLGRDPSDGVGSLRRRFVTPALLAAAFVVSVAVPAIGMWAMLLLFLAGPISARV